MLDKVIAIAGYSGHAFVVADAAFSAGISLSHYTDKDESKFNPYQLNYLGFESAPHFFENVPSLEFILGIGDNGIRKKVFHLLKSKEIKILNVIHDLSYVSKSVTFGEGNFISKNTSINPLVKIGNACIINTGAIVEHECKVGDYAHIAPGAVLAGNVTVGHGSFVGANAVVKEGIRIGANVVIGAGAVVTKNVLDNEVLVGNPAKQIQR